MLSLLQDLRYAWRMLARNPGFAIVAVLTLGLGIGANTAIFSVVNALLLRALPVKDPHQLVTLAVHHGRELPHGLSYPDYRDYRDQEQIFSDLAAYDTAFVSLTAGTQAERIRVQRVTDNFFSLLGVRAAHGRTLIPGEARAYQAGRVIVLSYRYWQGRFGGDPFIIGKTVVLNARPFDVVGVTQEIFPATVDLLEIDGFIPLTILSQSRPEERRVFEDRTAHNFRVIGRLQPGVSLREARVALAVQARRLEQEYPDSNKGVAVLAYPESMGRLEPAAAAYLPPVAAVFMALVGLVLLIACANVANLLLARAIGRRKEMAIRLALGAGRVRLIQQLLTESVLLALLGGGTGLLMALWATDLLSSMRLPGDLHVAMDLPLDRQVFAFTFVTAVLTGIISGLTPALLSARRDVNENLKEGSRGTGSSPGRSYLSRILVVSQVAVSMLLLVCAGLFLQAMWRASQMDLGIRLDHHLMFSMDIGSLGYDEGRGRIFYQELMERIRSLPGVRSASMARSVPFAFRQEGTWVFAEGHVSRKEEGKLSVLFNCVGTDYFRTVGTPIVSGRAFTGADSNTSPGVVIVNQALVEQLWPGQNPVGKRLSVVGEDGPFLEVIGVAAQGKYVLLGEKPRGYLYLPLSQEYHPVRTLHIYTIGDPRDLVVAARKEVRALDANLPIYDVQTMEHHIRKGKAFLPLQVATLLVGVFGLIGAALAAIGLYGVISYSVSQRTHEIGVRMALGAQRGEIFWFVARQGMALTLIGIVAGLAGALVGTRALSSLIVGVSPTDPLILGGSALLLAAVALLACFAPARYATRVDPMVALRHE